MPNNKQRDQSSIVVASMTLSAIVCYLPADCPSWQRLPAVVIILIHSSIKIDILLSHRKRLTKKVCPSSFCLRSSLTNIYNHCSRYIERVLPLRTGNQGGLIGRKILRSSTWPKEIRVSEMLASLYPEEGSGPARPILLRQTEKLRVSLLWLSSQQLVEHLFARQKNASRLQALCHQALRERDSKLDTTFFSN